MSGDRNEQPAAGVGKTPAERRTWRRLGGWLRGPGGWLRGPGGLRLGGWLRGPGGRRIGTALAVLAVTLSGIVIGVALGGRVETDIGPFRAELSISPAGHGRTTIAIPPLGALQLDSHAGPSHLTIRLGALDPGRTEELIDNPAMISRQTETAVDDLRAGVLRLAVRTTAVSVLATLILAALVFRGTRRTAWAGLLALTVTGGTLAYAGLTIRPESLDEPRYEGMLINAPAIVGDVRRIADDYNRYGEQLQQIIGNVSQALHHRLRAARLRAGSEHHPGAARLRHASEPDRLADHPHRRRAVRHRRGHRHRRHQRLGQRAGGLLRRGDRPARRPVRLHPRQPRLGDHRERGTQPAERDRPGRLGHHGRRAGHRRHR